MIRQGVLRYAEYIIDTSKAVEILSDAMRTDRRGRKPATNNLRLLLLGAYLTVHDRGSARVTDIYETLTNNIALQDQLRLGIRKQAADRKSFPPITLHDLYYQTKRIDQTLGYGHGRHPDLDDTERARRHTAIREVCDNLMDLFDLGFTSTTYALDATAFEAWARGREAKGPIENQIDRDAAWGHRTPTNLTMSKMHFGYAEHALVLLPHRDQERDSEPRLLSRFELTAANDDVVDVSLHLLHRLNRPASDLVIDSHYHYKDFERWNKQLVAAGINQHFHLRADEQKFEEFERMRWTAGWPHCPSTPDRFAVIEPPGPGSPQDQWEDHHDRIDERWAYAMRRVNSLNSDGKARYQCPALDGRVGCSLRDGTTAVAIRNAAPVIENPPGGPGDNEPVPACCTQGTVQIALEDRFAKHHQKHYWGSRKHRAEFKKRTYVEGKFGNTKNAATEALDRGIHQHHGLAMNHLVAAMINASYNTRILRNWGSRQLEKDPDFALRDHPLLQPVHDPDEYFMRVDGVTAYNLLGDEIEST